MNKRFASLALIAATIFCASAKNDDPVLMNVNGKDVIILPIKHPSSAYKTKFFNDVFKKIFNR